MVKYYDHPEPFRLEFGGEIRNLRIAYHTYGSLNERCDNVVWVCHALTANSDVQDWWPHTVEEGMFLDPSRYFIVCANFIGSPYGTTCPLSENPDTGQPYYADFPCYTIRDIVNAHRLLADALGIGVVHTLVGCSVGGFQAVEWAVMEPERYERLALMATDVIATPRTIAIDESQRMCIEADSTYGEPRPDAGAAGLAAARAIGLLSYRGPSGYNLTQCDSEEFPAKRRAVTYQRYQGEKLVKRFDAYSYHAILDSFDSHDVGRGRGGMYAALSNIKARTLVIGLTTDIVFPPTDMIALAARIPKAKYAEIHSPFGHDGFLVEYLQLNALMKPFMEQ